MTLDLTLDEVLKSLASFSPSSDIKTSAARMMWISAVRKAYSGKAHPRVAENVGYFGLTDADCVKLLTDLGVNISVFPPILAFQRALALAVELREAMREFDSVEYCVDVGDMFEAAFRFNSAQEVFSLPMSEVRACVPDHLKVGLASKGIDI